MKVAVLILFSIFSVSGNFSSIPNVALLSQNTQEINTVDIAQDSDSNQSVVIAGIMLCDVSAKIICEAGKISSNIILSISDLIKTNKTTTELFSRKDFQKGETATTGIKYVSSISRFNEKIKKVTANFKNNNDRFSYKNVLKILNLALISSVIYKIIHSKKHHTVKINIGNSDNDYYGGMRNNLFLDINKAFGYENYLSAFFIFNNIKNEMDILSI